MWKGLEDVFKKKQDHNHNETTAYFHEKDEHMDCLGPGRPKWGKNGRKQSPRSFLIWQKIDRKPFYNFITEIKIKNIKKNV